MGTLQLGELALQTVKTFDFCALHGRRATVKDRMLREEQVLTLPMGVGLAISPEIETKY